MKGYDEKCKELALYFLPKGTANVAIVDWLRQSRTP
jgi:hypothetical protein